MPYVKDSHGSYCQLSLQPNAVTDNDLLSLVAGISSDRAQDLFKHLKDYSSNPLAGLRHSNLEQLRNHLTLNQSLRVLAAIELGRRIFVTQPIAEQIIPI